jgi:hypothetical protein
MKTTTKKPDAFGSILAALAAVYEAEIARLADLYRPRILAGEFSGRHSADALAFLRLEEEIAATHPWARDLRAGRSVLAVSPWAYSDWTSFGHGCETELAGPALGEEVAECMSHDVLALAAARGWVKRYREHDEAPYALRVA